MSETFYNQTYPFTRVRMQKVVSGGTRVFWSLSTDFEETVSSFTLEYAFSGDNSWTTISSVSGSTFYADDSTQREYGLIPELFYRVKAVSDEGSTYYSAPSNIPNHWEWKDFRWAEEIKRKENLVNNKIGLTAWILVRRTSGTRCPDCADSISEEAQTSRCETCYSTSYQGGYYRPYECKARILGEGMQIAQGLLGTQGSSKMIIRYCPLPVVHEKDLVVLSGTDERFEVSKVETAASLKGLALIQHLTLEAIEFSDIRYQMAWNSGYSPTGATASNFEP